jgi:hypothetical protein
MAALPQRARRFHRCRWRPNGRQQQPLLFQLLLQERRQIRFLAGADMFALTNPQRVSLCVVFLALGCDSPQVWRHPNFSMQKFNIDNHECQVNSFSLAPVAMTNYPMFMPNGTVINIAGDANATNRERVYNNCMYARQYWLAPR